MATAELVRWQIEPLERDRRSVEDRLALLYPAAYRRLSAAVFRLPIGSRVRKALLSRALRTGFAAANRSDDDVRFLSFAADLEVHIADPGWWAVGVDRVYRGIDGAERLLDSLKGAFADLRWEPREVVDAGGGRFACRMDFVGVGWGSGVETRQEQWHAFVGERGLLVRQHVFSTENEALAVLTDPPQTLPGRARSARGEMGSVVVTRVQHPGPPRPSRNLEERLMVRFPGGWRALSALGLALISPRSRLRRRFLRRAVVSGWDAATRGDFELMLVRYAPDVEVEFAPDFEAVGLGGTFRGHDGMVKMISAFEDAWERRESRPTLILDLGDRVLNLGFFRLPGSASGLEFEREFAQLSTPRGGLVARDQYFFGWDKGLRAAGLDPDAIALPKRGTARQGASSTFR